MNSSTKAAGIEILEEIKRVIADASPDSIELVHEEKARKYSIGQRKVDLRIGESTLVLMLMTPFKEEKS